jgi:hypothetical protein
LGGHDLPSDDHRLHLRDELLVLVHDGQSLEGLKMSKQVIRVDHLVSQQMGDFSHNCH